MTVRPVWRLKESESVEQLARSIAAEDPHAVLIQHQPGLIQWMDLARLLQDRRVRNRVSVVALHAAARLLELAEEQRAGARSGLGQASRVLVHQIADLNLLKELGLTANVTLFPQGAPPSFAAPSTRMLMPRDTVILGSYGFFLPGKGLPRLIEAAAQLRQKWPRLSLKLINAEYPATTSHEEMVRCRNFANSLGLGNAIEWDTTFHPHDECMRGLAKCDLLILPYDESGESSSAALRSTMASGVPVAVTPIALFRDAGTAVHRFDEIDVASIAAGIDLLLHDRDARLRYQKAASVWLEGCSWDILARRLQGCSREKWLGQADPLHAAFRLRRGGIRPVRRLFRG
jgi:glycosyltransferase involved in cell wall biosynthesis